MMINNTFSTTPKTSQFYLFHSLNKSSNRPKKIINTFHDSIKKEKEQVYNMYAEYPDFKRILPNLHHGQKGIAFYNNMFKKVFKKKNFLSNIIEQIKSNKTKEKNIIQPLTQRIRKKYYELDELDIIRKQKLALEKRLKLHPKPIIKKNNSFLLKPVKINDSIDNLNEKQNYSNSMNLNLRKIKIKPLNNIKNIKAFTTRSQEKKIIKLNNLLDKCQSGISKGEKIGKKFDIFYKQIHKKDVKDDKEVNPIIDLFRDDIKEDLENQNSIVKFKELEEQKLREFKNDLNFKISDMLAYSNRKEYDKKVKSQPEINAYNLFLEEINSINRENQKKILIEKNTINKIGLLLDDFQVGKQLLNLKINKFKDKQEDHNNINGEYLINFDEELYISKEIEKLEKLKSLVKKKDGKRFLSKISNHFIP